MTSLQLTMRVLERDAQLVPDDDALGMALCALLFYLDATLKEWTKK